MNDRQPGFPQAQATRRGHGLQVGQAVEVKRGALAGMSGVLIGFSRGHHCRIELDVVQRGVMLVIDRTAVRKRPLVQAKATAAQAGRR